MSLTLLDWRRQVFALYAAAGRAQNVSPNGALAAFRAGRERLMQEHPQTPIRPEKRARSEGWTIGHATPHCASRPSSSRPSPNG